jgi:hypothetical protein
VYVLVFTLEEEEEETAESFEDVASPPPVRIRSEFFSALSAATPERARNLNDASLALRVSADVAVNGGVKEARAGLSLRDVKREPSGENEIGRSIWIPKKRVQVSSIQQ